MMLVLSGIFGFVVAIVVVYLRYKASSRPGQVDGSELQWAHWHAANVLGLVSASLLALYLFAVLVLRW
jgi:membrane protein CcdC involved in cytochrome C biogenesis